MLAPLTIFDLHDVADDELPRRRLDEAAAAQHRKIVLALDLRLQTPKLRLQAQSTTSERCTSFDCSGSDRAGQMTTVYVYVALASFE